MQMDGGGADSCARTIFAALEKLIDWLNNETDLFPWDFPSKYVELVLSTTLRSQIARVWIDGCDAGVFALSWVHGMDTKLHGSDFAGKAHDCTRGGLLFQ